MLRSKFTAKMYGDLRQKLCDLLLTRPLFRYFRRALSFGYRYF
ncbi:MAG: hypothetical protein SFV22_10505 [Saprospiraceae bacterium]|nr:hypothetical protein [Saprospiraceae bacterium]